MRIHKTLGFVFNVLLLFATTVPADEAKTEKLYYVIDQNSTVCGFAEVHIYPDVLKDKAVIAIDDSLEMNISAMGASVKGVYRLTYNDEINRNEISFAVDNDGNVSALILHQFVPLTKMAAMDEK